MQVELVSKTAGYSPEFENKTIDEILVGIARVSTSKNGQDLFKEPYKLLRHCLLNGHWSVFTMASMTFKIKTSRAIAREILRHKASNFQEYSQRYSKVLDLEPIELRLQTPNNRQSSHLIIEDEFLNDKLNDHLAKTLGLYGELLDNAVSRDTARFILPETAATTIYFHATIREIITFLNVRLHNTAQKEIILIAEEIKEIFIKECPIVSAALNYFKDAYNIHILDQLILQRHYLDSKQNQLNKIMNGKTIKPAYYTRASKLGEEILTLSLFPHKEYLGKECKETIALYGNDFNLGNALKYLWRLGEKAEFLGFNLSIIPFIKNYYVFRDLKKIYYYLDQYLDDACTPRLDNSKKFDVPFAMRLRYEVGERLQKPFL
jgi:thymidylate synthase (FAD)